MKELVLDLVASCENRISMVEELVTGAHYATATLDATLGELANERARLKTGLQEILARNCSFRRKDFNTLMDRITFESEGRKRELEEERKHVRDELEGYLDEQKQLVASLRQQLVDFSLEKGGKEALEATIAKMKVAYQHKGQQVFGLLRHFQLHLETFRREQEEINCKLQRLVERGESLKLEDLRQLEVAKASQERRAERELRRQEVERLLAHFKGQRQGGSRYTR
jgi:regulator of replication initiation timing